jgi:hypothetical protein
MISLLKLGSTIKKGERIRKLSEAKEEGIGLDAYSLFIFAIKSPFTRKKYIGRLIRFLESTGLVQGSVEERCKAFNFNT